MVFMAECQASYIVDCLKQMTSQRIVSFQVSTVFICFVFKFPPASRRRDHHCSFIACASHSTCRSHHGVVAGLSVAFQHVHILNMCFNLFLFFCSPRVFS